LEDNLEVLSTNYTLHFCSSSLHLSHVTIVLLIEPNIELASLVASAHCSEH